MPAYSYKAFDSLGNEQIGRINADSERAARKQLKNLNLIPLEITETLKKVKRSVRVKTKTLVLITRQLATLLNSSIPLDESLSIVSNHSSDDKFSKILSSSGARSIIDLQVSAPFHCSLMKPAADVMLKALQDVNIKKPIIKFINNVSAEFIDEPSEIKKKLIEQVYNRVRWRESILKVSKSNIDTILEIGSGKVLTGLNRRMKINQGLFNLSNMSDIENFIKLHGESL